MVSLSSILFKIVLERIMKAWVEDLEVEEIREIFFGRKRQDLEIKCLAFADDLSA